MDPDPWLGGALAAALLLLLWIGLLSHIETAVLSARRSRLTQFAGGHPEAPAAAIIERPEPFQASAHLAKSLGESLLYGVSALAGLRMAVPGVPPVTWSEFIQNGWPGALGALLVAYLAVSLLGESIPKAIASRGPEAVLIRWTGFIRVFTLLFTPIRWLTVRTGRLIASAAGAEPALTTRAAHSEEEIKLLVEGSAEEGVLEEEEKEMIASIFEFTDTVVRQVMVPRIDIHSVSVEAGLDDVVRAVLDSGHSRIPVYDGTLDNVIGVLHVKDLLPHLVDGRRETPISGLMRRPFFVPEGKKIDELLQEFRRNKSQLAIVVDEFGGTSGLVTIEDVVEEIVGEIEDEYDVEVPPGAEISATGEGVLVDGRMTVEDVNEALSLELPRGDYDTIGGFVFSLLGHPPVVGERVTFESLEFVVEAVEGLRLTKVRILAVPPEEPPTEEPAPR